MKKLHPQLQQLDHILGISRKHLGQEPLYLIKDNEILLEKWCRYGFDEEIFHNHPDFARFLFDSNLASQIKITRDKIIRLDGSPAILVEGQWTTFDELKDRFAFKFDAIHHETVLYEKKSGEVYTYLDLGQGLECFNPYKEGLQKPMSRLTQEEYERTLACANQFIRVTDLPDETPPARDYIFQIVSSTIETNTENPWVGNFRKLFIKPQHPYIRIINPLGEVFETGFMLGKKLKEPLITERGKFRSIDLWELKQPLERIVTNIAISKEEFEKAQAYVDFYLNSQEKPAFNYLKQNCTVFAKNILRASTGINIPTQMSLFKIIKLASPEAFKIIGTFFVNCVKTITKPIINITPQWLKKAITYVATVMKKVAIAVATFFFSIVNMMLGGLRGAKGRKFTTNSKKRNLFPPLLKLKNWYRAKVYDINFIAPLQNWQKVQQSTIIYNRPIKLSITA